MEVELLSGVDVEYCSVLNLTGCALSYIPSTNLFTLAVVIGSRSISAAASLPNF